MPDNALEVAAQAQAPVTVEEAEQAPAIQEAEEGDNADVQKDAQSEPEGEKPQPTVEELQAKLEHQQRKMQKSFDRKTAHIKQLEEKISKLTEQMQSAPKADDTPKEADYATWEEYEQALVEHKANKLAEERVQKAKEDELQKLEAQRWAERAKSFEAKAKEIADVYPDYQDVVGVKGANTINELQAAGVDVSPFQMMMMEFDNAPHMLYELAKNEDVLEDVVQMKPLAMMRELVKLELTLQKPVKQVKDVPPPINTTKGMPKGKDFSKMSGKELLKEFGIS